MWKGILLIEGFFIICLFFSGITSKEFSESPKTALKECLGAFIFLHILMLIILYFCGAFDKKKTCNDLCVFNNQEMQQQCVTECNTVGYKKFSVQLWEDSYYEYQAYIEQEKEDDRYWRCYYYGDCDNAKTVNKVECNIKGNISFGGEKIYHLPGCESYNDTVINTKYGERRFCSEQEAIQAGRRKARNC